MENPTWALMNQGNSAHSPSFKHIPSTGSIDFGHQHNWAIRNHLEIWMDAGFENMGIVDPSKLYLNVF